MAYAYLLPVRSAATIRLPTPHTRLSVRRFGIFLLIAAILVISPSHHLLAKWGQSTDAVQADKGSPLGDMQADKSFDAGEPSSCLQLDGVVAVPGVLPQLGTYESSQLFFAFFAHRYAKPDLKPPVLLPS